MDTKYIYSPFNFYLSNLFSKCSSISFFSSLSLVLRLATLKLTLAVLQVPLFAFHSSRTCSRWHKMVIVHLYYHEKLADFSCCLLENGKWDNSRTHVTHRANTAVAYWRMESGTIAAFLSQPEWLPPLLETRQNLTVAILDGQEYDFTDFNGQREREYKLESGQWNWRDLK